MIDRLVHDPAKIALRRTEVAKLRLRGRPIEEIALSMRVSRPTVYRDLEASFEEWRADRVQYIGLEREMELERIAHREAEAWDAWERSKQDAERSQTTTGEAGRVVTIETVERRCGDPRFLAVVHHCQELRCKILGLYLPENVAASNPAVENLTMDQRRQRLLALVDRLRVAQGDSGGAGGTGSNGNGQPGEPGSDSN